MENPIKMDDLGVPLFLETPMPLFLSIVRNYGWWTKSCTTKDDYPIIYRVLTIPGGCLEFCPSTVLLKKQEGFEVGISGNPSKCQNVNVGGHRIASWRSIWAAILVTSTYQPNLTWATKNKNLIPYFPIESTGCLFGILISCFMKTNHNFNRTGFHLPIYLIKQPLGPFFHCSPCFSSTTGGT